MRVSLSFLLSSHRHATMLGAGNDLQAEFATKTNFGSVVAVKGNALEHSKKIAFELLVPLRDGVAVASGAVNAHSDSLIHGAHLCELLNRRSIDEVFSIQFVALLVDNCEPFEKMVTVLVGSPFGEDHVDEFIDAGTLSSRRVGLWNNHFAHEDNSSVLVRIERAECVTRSGVRSLEKREKFRCKSRSDRSRG